MKKGDKQSGIAIILSTALLFNCVGCSSDESDDGAVTALLLALIAGGLAVASHETEYPVSDFAREQAIERCIKDESTAYLKVKIESGELVIYTEQKAEPETQA